MANHLELLLLGMSSLFAYCSSNSSATTEDNPQVGNYWQIVEQGLQNEMHGAAIDANDNIYSSGGDAIWVRIGGKPSKIFFADIRFEKMWVSSDNVAWTVGNDIDPDSNSGDAGIMISCKDKQWERSTLIADIPLTGICGNDKAGKYVSGSQIKDGTPWGVVLNSSDGKEAEVVYEKEGYWFSDVWTDSEDRIVVAVGQTLGGETGKGIIVMRDEYGQWKDITILADDYIYVSVWGVSDKELFVVGQVAQQGRWESGELPLSTVLRWNGETMMQAFSPMNDYLWTVGGIDSKQIFFGGAEWILDDSGNPDRVRSTKILRWNQENISIGTIEDDLLKSAITEFAYSSRTKTAYAFTVDGSILKATGGPDTDSDTDNDVDTDTDVDSDSDSETDQDTGLDTDSEIDSDLETYWMDDETGLIWQSVIVGEMLWSDAKSYCDTLDWAGQTDWRFPTIDELRTLIRGCDNTENGGACRVAEECLNSECGDDSLCDGCTSDAGPKDGCYRPEEFDIQPDISCFLMWSSSVVDDDDSRAWGIDFGGGAIFKGNVDAYAYVFCLR